MALGLPLQQCCFNFNENHREKSRGGLSMSLSAHSAIGFTSRLSEPEYNQPH
jgi:hypothetical protein